MAPGRGTSDAGAAEERRRTVVAVTARDGEDGGGGGGSSPSPPSPVRALRAGPKGRAGGGTTPPAAPTRRPSVASPERRSRGRMGRRRSARASRSLQTSPGLGVFVDLLVLRLRGLFAAFARVLPTTSLLTVESGGMAPLTLEV